MDDLLVLEFIMVLDGGAIPVFSGVVPDVVLRIEVTAYEVMSGCCEA